MTAICSKYRSELSITGGESMFGEWVDGGVD